MYDVGPEYKVPKLYKLLRRTDYAKFLRSVVGDYTLPSFPGTTMLVLERIREADASISSVVGALSLDPWFPLRRDVDIPTEPEPKPDGP